MCSAASSLVSPRLEEWKAESVCGWARVCTVLWGSVVVCCLGDVCVVAVCMWEGDPSLAHSATDTNRDHIAG